MISLPDNTAGAVSIRREANSSRTVGTGEQCVFYFELAFHTVHFQVNHAALGGGTATGSDCINH